MSPLLPRCFTMAAIILFDRRMPPWVRRMRLSAPGAPPASPEPGIGGGRGGRWSISTAHLGVRFASDYAGPGLKVRDVLPEGPAARAASKIEAGEIVLSIDGKSIDPAMDLTLVLNGVLDRDVRLRVKAADGKERDVSLRPISYLDARRLLYDAWVKQNRRQVDRLSQGKLGYLHISGMSMPNFYKFEEELYAVGAGKDGLVIDVRENPGGSITDHLLTVLTQPIHAITVPRGGGPGYPQDRIVYATWRKPIVVLCNQNSFSNAEIFSHAIRALGRGKVVGVPTAGTQRPPSRPAGRTGVCGRAYSIQCARNFALEATQSHTSRRHVSCSTASH